MKKLFSIFCLTFLFAFVVITNSCAPPANVAQRITIESGQIPPDMKNEDFTLIGVLKGRNSYDKYVEKEFNDYSGKYVLATSEEIMTTYKDVNKYRYILDCNVSNDEYYAPASPGSNSRGYSSTTGYRYSILDRKDGKKYVRKSESSFLLWK